MMPKTPPARPRARGELFPALAAAAALFLLLCGVGAPAARAQSVGKFEIERGRQMLRVVKSDVEKSYYDPGYRGVDIETRFKEADEMIKKAQSNGQIFGIIANVLVSFNDSHLFFIPPSRNNRVDYGWRMQMVGDACYVVAVKPGSDAEAKGLKEGDAVLSVDGMTPMREDFWKLQYLYHALRPQGGMRVVVQAPGGRPRQLDVLSDIREGQRITDLTDYNEYMRLVIEEEKDSRLRRHRYAEVGKELFVWKMPQFDLPKEKVEDMLGKFRGHKSVVIDLRGNGGGYEETLLRLVGGFFEKDVKVGDLTRRKESKPLVARAAGERAYKGGLVVLVDSDSGSSSELFARVVQLEKRGTVLGDRTSGAVMRARQFSHQVGIDTVAFYGVSVTDADLLMTDGKSLERVGVTPDELLLPSAEDMAARRDPVLARAAALLGVKLGAEEAGALFPVEWKK